MLTKLINSLKRKKKVIITGADGFVGSYTVQHFLNNGKTVLALDMGPEPRRLKEHKNLTYMQCDITDTARVEAAVDEVYKTFGRIDILINNAGTGAVAPAEDITDDQFKGEMDIDLFGTFKVARAVAKKAMIPAKYGRIINIASMYGLVGNKIAGSAPYHAAKGGVVNMTRALAAEWGKYSITVNSICPGYFYTPLTKETLDSDFFQANAKTMIPEERYGNEGELDSAAIFLASPSSSYVTGVNLPVDGGYTAM